MLIDENNKSCYEAENFTAIGVGISEQLRSAVFDGECCYQGAPHRQPTVAI